MQMQTFKSFKLMLVWSQKPKGWGKMSRKKRKGKKRIRESSLRVIGEFMSTRFEIYVGKCTDFFGGNSDLAGFLVGLLQDEPDHLLHLLPDVGIVHLGCLLATNSTDRRVIPAIERTWFLARAK